MSAASKASVSHKSLTEALAAARKDMQPAKLDSTSNAYGKDGYSYASLTSICEAARPLAEHGIAWVQSSELAPDGVSVRTVLHFNNGTETETLDGGAVSMPVASKTPHSYMSAITYCRRASLSIAAGAYGDTDDDGTAAMEPPKRGAGVKKDVLATNTPVLSQEDIDMYKVQINTSIQNDDWTHYREVMNDLEETSDPDIARIEIENAMGRPETKAWREYDKTSPGTK
jgi:hypothetical protein